MKNNKKNFIDYLKEINELNNSFTINNSINPNLGSINFYDFCDAEFKKIVFENTYNRLLNLLLVMFKWEVPEFINSRVIELALIFRGGIAFFKNLEKGKKLNIDSGFLCLPATPSNVFNIYGEPTQVRVTGFNGFNKNIEIINNDFIPTEFEQWEQEVEGYGIYARDNDTNYKYINYVTEFASSITDKKIALCIATQNLKKPFIMIGHEAYLKETADKITNKIKNNEPTIFILKNNNSILNEQKNKPFDILNLPTNSEAVKALQDSILFDFNMFLEIIGINTNPSPDKTQVVLTSEINSNNILISKEQKIRFKNRLKFCEDIKKLFNVDLRVEIDEEDLKNEIEIMKKEIVKNDIETDTENNK